MILPSQHRLLGNNQIVDFIADCAPFLFRWGVINTGVVRIKPWRIRGRTDRHHPWIIGKPLAIYSIGQEFPLKPYFRPPASMLDDPNGREWNSIIPTKYVGPPLQVHRIADFYRPDRFMSHKIYHGSFAIISLIALLISAARGHGSPVLRRNSLIQRSRASSSSDGMLNEKRFSVRIGSYCIPQVGTLA